MTSPSISNIYIARISSFVTEENIRAELAELGNIIRIDFTPIGKKPGFVENLEGNIKSAFVHFDRPLIYSTISVRLAEYGSIKLYPTFLCGREYWILRTIQSPIPDTMMNNAQIVANCRFLENKVEEQAATIKAMEEKLDGVQRVVYQLLGGLFNHDSQGGTLSNHLNMLFKNDNDIPESEDEEDTSKWTSWPTTRQGDENADRIAALEAQIQDLKNVTDSVSTHSSMPGLIAVNESESDDETSSMPDLVEASSESDSDNELPELVDVEDGEEETRQQEETRLRQEEQDDRVKLLLRSQELGWGGKHFLGWF